MHIVEILLIVFLVLFVVAVLGVYIYKKLKKKPTGECSCCASSMKSELKRAKREIKKNK